MKLAKPSTLLLSGDHVPDYAIRPPPISRYEACIDVSCTNVRSIRPIAGRVSGIPGWDNGGRSHAHFHTPFRWCSPVGND
jgi:hypothetical protein